MLTKAEDVSSSFRPFPLLSQSGDRIGGERAAGVEEEPGQEVRQFIMERKRHGLGRSELKWRAIVLVATICR